MTIRVLVVDDQQLVRAGLIRILSPEPDLEIVGECEDGDEVEAAVRDVGPDVVVMDVRMRRMGGAEATRRLQADLNAPPVLVLTTFGDEATVAASLGAGAAGFILKDARGEELVHAVRTVAGGGAWLDPEVTPGVLAAYRAIGLPRVEQAARLDELSQRENEVLRLMSRGLSNAEIGEELYIGEGTVKTHINRIFAKLQVRDRAAAIVFAFDHGIARPGGP